MKKTLVLIFFLAYLYPLQGLASTRSAKIVSVRPNAFVLFENERENASVADQVNQGETLQT